MSQQNSTIEPDSESPAPNTGEEAASARRRRIGKTLIAAVALFAALLLWSSAVFVDEMEFVIIERFGRIREDGTGVYDRPEDRGLHFKLPWPVETVRRFDRRLQIFDPPAREIHTQKKRNVVVDAYVCWRIAGSESGSEVPAGERPVVRFFRALGDLERADARLDARLRSILPAEIGKITLAGLLHADDSRSGPGFTEAGSIGERGLLEQVSGRAGELVVRQPGENRTLTERFGIEIVDVRIKRLTLPSGNRQAVYDRMRSDRKKETNRERGAGLAQKQVIEGQAKRQYEEILARARADAERIRGDGEARALETLNAAYSQDREFFHVVRTLESYQKILNERTTLVLSASSNLMKLLTDGVPAAGPASQQPAPSTEGGTPPSPPTSSEGGTP